MKKESKMSIMEFNESELTDIYTKLAECVDVQGTVLTTPLPDDDFYDENEANISISARLTFNGNNISLVFREKVDLLFNPGAIKASSLTAYDLDHDTNSDPFSLNKPFKTTLAIWAKDKIKITGKDGGLAIKVAKHISQNLNK